MGWRIFTARDLLYELANILYPDEFRWDAVQNFEFVGLDVQVIAEAELEKWVWGRCLAWGKAPAVIQLL